MTTWSANTQLLLHLEGANNSTTFTDSSSIPKPVTRYGNTIISTAKSKWGNGSAYFDGVGDYLNFPVSLSNTLSFTLECWFSATNYTLQSGPSCALFGKLPTGAPAGRWYFGVNNTGVLTVWCGPTGYNGIIVFPNDAAWHHAALVLDVTLNNMRIYLDGVLDSTFAKPTFYITPDINIAFYNTPEAFTGYIQDARITMGIARYSANFTPPSALLPDPTPCVPVRIESGRRIDLYDGGAYRITGTVTELGVAGPYRVRLFDRQSARCVQETWSNAVGNYAFDSIAYRPNGYFAIAYDHGDNPLNAAIADLITPELMP